MRIDIRYSSYLPFSPFQFKSVNMEVFSFFLQTYTYVSKVFACKQRKIHTEIGKFLVKKKDGRKKRTVCLLCKNPQKKGAKAKTRISFPLKPEFSKLENSERLDRKQLFLIPKTSDR